MLYKISWRILAFLVLLLFIKRVFPGRSLIWWCHHTKKLQKLSSSFTLNHFLFQNRKTLVNHVKYSSSVTCIKWIPTEVHFNLVLIINDQLTDNCLRVFLLSCLRIRQVFVGYSVLQSAWIYRKVFIFYYFIFLAEEGLSKCFQILNKDFLTHI